MANLEPREKRANQARGLRMGGQESQESPAFQEKREFEEKKAMKAYLVNPDYQGRQETEE